MTDSVAETRIYRLARVRICKPGESSISGSSGFSFERLQNERR
jgi:hypothetical protein